MSLESDPILGPQFHRVIERDYLSMALGIAFDRLEVEVLKWRPQRRATFLITSSSNGAARSWIGKIRHNKRAGRIVERLNDLGEALSRHPDARFAIPSPRFFDPERHFHCYEAIQGTAFSERWTSGDDCLEHGARIAQALAQFHSLTCRNVLSHGEQGEIALLKQLIPRLPGDCAQGVQTRLGILEEDAGQLAPPSRLALCHRDFYPEQILIQDDGRVGMIDLEDIAMGRPELDLGNFFSHLWRYAVDSPPPGPRILPLRHAMVRSYEAESAPIDESALIWHEAATAMRLACHGALKGSAPEYKTHIARLDELLQR